MLRFDTVVTLEVEVQCPIDHHPVGEIDQLAELVPAQMAHGAVPVIPRAAGLSVTVFQFPTVLFPSSALPGARARVTRVRDTVT